MRFSSGGLREWGTYLGGDGIDVAQSCAIDPSGNLYVAGYTSSRPDIATSGVHQASYGGGEMDAFLVKFAAGGERLWGTYYGGSGKDQGYACAVEPTGGAVYLAGRTESFENIATPSAHQLSQWRLWEGMVLSYGLLRMGGASGALITAEKEGMKYTPARWFRATSISPEKQMPQMVLPPLVPINPSLIQAPAV